MFESIHLSPHVAARPSSEDAEEEEEDEDEAAVEAAFSSCLGHARAATEGAISAMLNVLPPIAHPGSMA